MHLDLTQWLLAGASALLIGISKTALPGAGILVVTMLAMAFGGWKSIGIMLPMLILADCFAVAWYRHHAKWREIARIVPGVFGGLAVGALSLWIVGRMKGDRDVLGTVIGILTLVMLLTHILRNRMDERLTPKTRTGIAIAGVFVGFATIVSNAAGPMMAIYMAARRLTKKEFMGTLAWYFFSLNTAKLFIYFGLNELNLASPIITSESFVLVAYVSPGIALGAIAGKWLLPRISQKLFENMVLLLSGLAAIKLILG